jgi:hypothetical protein
MKHFTLELFLFALIIFIVSLQNRVITVNFSLRPIQKNADKILIWLAGIILSVIISSWFN